MSMYRLDKTDCNDDDMRGMQMLIVWIPVSIGFSMAIIAVIAVIVAVACGVGG